MKSPVSLRYGLLLALAVLAAVYVVSALNEDFLSEGLAEAVFDLFDSESEAGLNAQQPAPQTQEIFTQTPEHYLATDVESLIAIREADDVKRMRSELIRFLWGNQGLPSNLPTTVIQDFDDERYDDVSQLARIDRLSIGMAYGLMSHAYHFVPSAPTSRIVLFHQGHRGDFHISKKLIVAFLEHGYAVIAFNMPLLGHNNQPEVELPSFGRLKLTTHEHMKFLSPEQGHPVQFFIEPVVTAINYAESSIGFTQLSMVGISGGGWTATLAAAVDERIQKSFPVAGSYPLFLRSRSERDWGDYEQTVPELYRTANYLELYVLGAVGDGRQQLQIINQFDPCCFAGTKHETYASVVAGVVERLGGGRFDLMMDATHTRHAVSASAMARILSELDKD